MIVHEMHSSGNDLKLRPPNIEDAAPLFQLMSNPQLTEFLAWEPHKTVQMTKEIIDKLLDAAKNEIGYHWLILKNDRIIGLISLIDIKRKFRNWEIDRAELSYWIDPENQGRGYATESSRVVIDFGFLNIGLHKIIVAHAAANIASRKVIEKLGFKKYATERDAFKKNGIWNDMIWYDMLKSEYIGDLI